MLSKIVQIVTVANGCPGPTDDARHHAFDWNDKIDRMEDEEKKEGSNKQWCEDSFHEFFKRALKCPIQLSINNNNKTRNDYS